MQQNLPFIIRGFNLGMVLISLLTACGGKGEMKIDGKTTIFLPELTKEPIRKAVADLATDMAMVFGKKPRLVSELDSCREPCIVVSSGSDLPAEIQAPAGPERILQKIWKQPREGLSQALVLTGSDLRGVIYSVYDFSERFLGVAPLYWWTDKLPEPKKSVQIPVDYEFRSEPPTIRYRGLFINDEDLLSGWRPGTWGLSGIHPEVWDRLFEALLRMKGNMITPGTFIFPYEPQVAAAGKRGLIITQHHAEVLGLNVYRWPEETVYSFQNNREKLVSAWTTAVEQYPADQEVLWTVGYRGRHDRAFWEDEGSAPATEKARAELISSAIQAQIDLVRERRKDPKFVMNSWGEGTRFIKKGYLTLPEEVTLVWADRGWGVIRDEGNLKEGDGLYYHVAMFNHKANQLTEMVPIARIQRELTRAASAKATAYFLLNTSDFKPVMMSAQAALDMAWNIQPWLVDTGHYRQYLLDWSSAQFGEALGLDISRLYLSYYQTPARYGPDETYRMGDNYYTRMSRLYLRRMETGDTTTYMEKVDWDRSVADNAKILIRLCREASPRWNALHQQALEIADRVPEDRKNFYIAHVLAPINIHRHGNEMLIKTMQAFLAEEKQQKIQHLRSAREQTNSVLRAFDEAEYGKWRGFYQNDFMTGFRSAGKCIDLALNRFQGKPGREKIDNYINDWDLWDMVKAYQGNQSVLME